MHRQPINFSCNCACRAALSVTVVQGQGAAPAAPQAKPPPQRGQVSGCAAAFTW